MKKDAWTGKQGLEFNSWFDSFDLDSANKGIKKSVGRDMFYLPIYISQETKLIVIENDFLINKTKRAKPALEKANFLISELKSENGVLSYAHYEGINEKPNCVASYSR